MPIPIPKSVVVGRTRYDIVVQASPRKGFGCIYYAQRVIQIAPRRESGMALTFWHELTHAVLHDMGHRLANNERFVEQFSTRLHKAVLTARFE